MKAAKNVVLSLVGFLLAGCIVIPTPTPDPTSTPVPTSTPLPPTATAHPTKTPLPTEPPAAFTAEYGICIFPDWQGCSPTGTETLHGTDNSITVTSDTSGAPYVYCKLFKNGVLVDKQIQTSTNLSVTCTGY